MLLAGCDAEQVEAITTPAQPLCVLAGAGSGKTRVLTRRIAWRVATGSATAAHVLALTFTRKAAAELRTRLGSLGLPEPVRAGTFHSVALGELKRLASERRVAPPVVLPSKAGLLAHVTTGWSQVPGSARGRGTRRSGGNGGRLGEPLFPLAELAQEIEWAKARCLRPVDYERAAAIAARTTPWPPALVSEAWEAYELEKARRRVLDFEDLLVRCATELDSDAEFAASARWRLRHFFVDEYQDVNEAQLRLLRAWLGDRGDLCVVGDPDQAIYGWNGSDPGAISRFASDFPGAELVHLRTNYRSTREVLTVAGAVLGHSEPAPAGGPVAEGPPPTVTEFATDLDEADGVAASIRLAKKPGRRWSQIAVLARTNAQLVKFEQALSRRDIPWRTTGSDSFLTRAHVDEALGVAAKVRTAAELASLATDLRNSAVRLSDDEGAESAGVSGDGTRAADGELADLSELASLIDEYVSEDVTATGSGFRSWVEASVRAEEAAVATDSVTLTTFHRAKGLEWPVVFLTGLEHGLVPIAYATEPDALAEERRLLYVACTRAGEELHCSFARERTFSAASRPSVRSPSPWLRAIEAAERDLRRLGRSSKLTAREAIAQSRELLAGP
jgi:DNA helicase-2/ATP-dependent DNA helicase PcrA